MTDTLKCYNYAQQQVGGVYVIALMDTSFFGIGFLILFVSVKAKVDHNKDGEK